MISQERETEKKNVESPTGFELNLPGAKQLQIAIFPYNNSIHYNNFRTQHGMLFYRLADGLQSHTG